MTVSVETPVTRIEKDKTKKSNERSEETSTKIKRSARTQRKRLNCRITQKLIIKLTAFSSR